MPYTLHLIPHTSYLIPHTSYLIPLTLCPFSGPCGKQALVKTFLAACADPNGLFLAGDTCQACILKSALYSVFMGKVYKDADV